VNKFDPTSSFFRIIDAENRHPDPADGKVVSFVRWEKPLVRVGELYGRATAYTPHYGLVEWYDQANKLRCEWFPAADIKRVDREDWHGRRMPE
jgi:hypothetical protein